MFTYPQKMKVLMSQTDELLYQAKSIGRACYVIGTETETTAGGPRLMLLLTDAVRFCYYLKDIFYRNNNISGT